MRTIWLVSLVIFGLVELPQYVQAEPRDRWQPVATAAPWVAAAADEVQSYGSLHKPTAVMIVRDGHMVASWGEVSRKVNVRSVRKSLLGGLYGIAVAERRIDLTRTLEQLGIDDKPPSLTQAEKQATVRDLLMSRSGVYHPAAYEAAEMQKNRPARGSNPAGTFWYYNNWDFNTLGTIYREATGEDIFQSFARRIAQPIEMEDYSARDGRYVFHSSSSHPAYPFSMTARDLARFGLLMLNDGRWNGTQIIPAAWIRESANAYSQTDRSGRSYGYLWWVLPPAEWGSGAVIASGWGGQTIAIVPAKRLVAVQVIEHPSSDRQLKTKDLLDLLRKIAAIAS